MNILLRVSGVFIILLANTLSAAQEQQLLSDAISQVQAISPDMAIKDRLSRYESVLAIIDTITSKYGGTDVGLQLKTSQSIGNFKVDEIKAAYLTDLFEYYDTVCEKSPSYTCLGFVSLKSGNEMCLSANDFDTLRRAHKSLINAITIFKGQKAKRKYVSLALDSYRNCKKSASGISEDMARDYFRMELVTTLLSLKEDSIARGLIEQMSLPLFKFKSVLVLKEVSREALDQKYVDRLKQYIKTKMPDDREVDNFFSRLALAKMIFRHGPYPISYKDARYGFFPTAKRIIDDRTCEGFHKDNFFDSIVEYIDILSGVPKEKLTIDKAQMLTVLTEQIPSGTRHLFSKCDDVGKPYAIALRLIGELYAVGNRDGAVELYEFVKSAPRTPIEVFAKYVDDHVNKIDDMKKKKIGRMLTVGFDIEKFSKRYGLGSEGKYTIYKKYVSLGEVCKSAEILFKELKGTPFYESAIDYMISSPSVNSASKYSCGDEDLELLLK